MVGGNYGKTSPLHTRVRKDGRRTRDSEAKVNMASVCPKLIACFSSAMTVAVFR